jgi:hypothetical protein
MAAIFAIRGFRASLSVAFHKYGVAPRGPMRRIRRGVATEAYWASTSRKRNEAGADAAGLECNRIYETQH